MRTFTLDEDRRKKQRFSLSLSVVVRVEDEQGTEICGVTRDVSSAGAFLLLPGKEVPNCDLATFELVLPPDITLADAVKVACRARVLRIEPGAGNLIGLATQITDFDLLPSA
jgi:c-di-GMP-binding flagellar brake protein YcgR